MGFFQSGSNVIRVLRLCFSFRVTGDSSPSVSKILAVTLVQFVLVISFGVKSSILSPEVWSNLIRLEGNFPRFFFAK